ncbi:hypothetical protein OIU85_005088 [Salix viminalis]|uniref:Uncharacterized protein n=1 Tax=Salix viminalis TaxID=40686 RepID=A0A9Q0SYQ5_SALVM|nr:hypothetical protein OIU85_005088 [Salix viminalis]
MSMLMNAQNLETIQISKTGKMRRYMKEFVIVLSLVIGQKLLKGICSPQRMMKTITILLTETLRIWKLVKNMGTIKKKNLTMFPCRRKMDQKSIGN